MFFICKVMFLTSMLQSTLVVVDQVMSRQQRMEGLSSALETPKNVWIY